ncbi:putative solute:sodium symporter small subunit [Paraburkholderia sp. JPY681]|nr:putative solute:sodium symporter small subunit [Paraburkholderia atlantica]
MNPPPEPPPVSVAMALAHRKYWRFNLALIAVLMTLGFFVSFVVPLLAPALARLRVGGFSLPFYFGAQGAILIYLALIVVYIVLMQRADRQLQRAFEADSQRDAASGPAADSTRDANDDVNVDTDAPAARGR